MVLIRIVNPHVLTADGGIDWTQVPDGGFAHVAGEPVRAPYTPAVGEVIDRYGPPGRFVSPVPESGSYAYGARALPYVEDAGQYHRYQVVGDMNDIPSAVRNHPDDEVHRGIVVKLEKYSVDLDGLRVDAGPIAPGFGHPGGGAQYLFPLSTQELEDLGLIREIGMEQE